MPYNSYFPATYQPIYPQYNNWNAPQAQPAQQPIQPQTSNGIIWVQGEAGARAYLVAPNSTVQLWDSEKQTIYLKSADASGVPSFKILDYTIRETAQNTPIKAPESVENSFATKEEVNALLERLTALQGKIEAFTAKQTTKAKKEVNDGE